MGLQGDARNAARRRGPLSVSQTPGGHEMKRARQGKRAEARQALVETFREDPLARALGARIGRAFGRQALGKPLFTDDEPWLWLAMKANVGPKVQRWAGSELLAAVNAARTTSPIEGLEGLGDALAQGIEGLGDALAQQDGEAPAATDEEESDIPQVPAKEEEEETPEDGPGTGHPEEIDDPPRGAQYRILIDVIRVVEETDGGGDDELQWAVNGGVEWANGTKTSVNFQSREHQDINTGSVLSVATPDRRSPEDQHHRILMSSESVVVNHGDLHFFTGADFVMTQFFLTLFEVDSTSTMVEFFGLLADLLETGAGILNPLAGLSQLITAGTSSSPGELRDAATRLKKIFDALVPDDLLDEKEFIVTRNHLERATYEAVQEAEYKSAFKARDVKYSGDGFEYWVEVRFDRLL